MSCNCASRTVMSRMRPAKQTNEEYPLWFQPWLSAHLGGILSVRCGSGRVSDKRGAVWQMMWRYMSLKKPKRSIFGWLVFGCAFGGNLQMHKGAESECRPCCPVCAWRKVAWRLCFSRRYVSYRYARWVMDVSLFFMRVWIVVVPFGTFVLY